MRNALVFFTACVCLGAQPSGGPSKGTVILDGGGGTDPVKDRFLSIAGKRIVAIPTGASSIRFGPQNIILDPDSPRDRPEWIAYEAYLREWLRTETVTVLHTRDRSVADSEAFTGPLREATGVFIGQGNAGRIAATYLDTRTHRELRNLLDRDGVIFGSSAGAIIMGSFVVRGWPEKPLLMAPGRDRGFSFLKNVAINPHLTEAKRDYELINVVDAHPDVLGIGIDEPAGLVVRGNQFEVIGGRAAIYDNRRHGSAWYYFLKPGDHFDLATWRRIE
jgi:cyanophycinase